jgi:serine/threonine protein kinase
MAGLEDFPEIEDYDPIQIAGKGAFGTVFLVKNQIGRLRALKVIWRKKFSRKDHFEKEFEGIRKYEKVALESEFLISILHIGGSPKDEFYYYIMEAADPLDSNIQYTPDTLSTRLSNEKTFSKNELVSITNDLCNALSVLHSNGLLHRDIKASNILFVNAKPKLGDPGAIQYINHASTYIGTSGYLAPEGATSVQSDIFALGKVVYRMMSGSGVESFPSLPEFLYLSKDAEFYRKLNDLVFKACEIDTKGRFQTVNALQEIIKKIDPSNCREKEPLKHKRFMFKVFPACLVLVLVFLSVFIQTNQKTQLEEPREELINFIQAKNPNLQLEKILKKNLKEWNFGNGFAIVLNGDKSLIFSAIANEGTNKSLLLHELDLFYFTCSEKNYDFIWEILDKKNKKYFHTHNLLRAKLGNHSRKKLNLVPTEDSNSEKNFIYLEITPEQLNKIRKNNVKRKEVLPIITSCLLSAVSNELQLGDTQKAFNLLMNIQKFGYNGVELFLRVYQAFLIKGESLEALRVAKYISQNFPNQVDFDTCLKLAKQVESANFMELHNLWISLSELNLKSKIQL